MEASRRRGATVLQLPAARAEARPAEAQEPCPTASTEAEVVSLAARRSARLSSEFLTAEVEAVQAARRRRLATTLAGASGLPVVVALEAVPALSVQEALAASAAATVVGLRLRTQVAAALEVRLEALARSLRRAAAAVRRTLAAAAEGLTLPAREALAQLAVSRAEAEAEAERALLAEPVDKAPVAK